MNDFIQRIGPVERDIDPVYRVERANEEGEKREPEQRKKRREETQTQTPEDVGPTEGDDGHLHIDVRA